MQPLSCTAKCETVVVVVAGSCRPSEISDLVSGTHTFLILSGRMQVHARVLGMLPTAPWPPYPNASKPLCSDGGRLSGRGGSRRDTAESMFMLSPHAHKSNSLSSGQTLIRGLWGQKWCWSILMRAVTKRDCMKCKQKWLMCSWLLEDGSEWSNMWIVHAINITLWVPNRSSRNC